MKISDKYDPIRREPVIKPVAPAEANGLAGNPERTAELRRKVLDGAYNTLDVVDLVARRILQRGDL